MTSPLPQAANAVAVQQLSRLSIGMHKATAYFGASSFLHMMVRVYITEGLCEIFCLMIQQCLPALASTTGGFDMSALGVGLLLPLTCHMIRFFMVFHTENMSCRGVVVFTDALLACFHGTRIVAVNDFVVSQLISMALLLINFVLCSVSLLGWLGMGQRELLPNSRPSKLETTAIGTRVNRSYVYDAEDSCQAAGIDDENRLCIICMDAFRPGEALTELHCRHRFHDDCIYQWSLSNDSCPMRCPCTKGTLLSSADPTKNSQMNENRNSVQDREV
jgi:hypothetical protein